MKALSLLCKMLRTRHIALLGAQNQNGADASADPTLGDIYSARGVMVIAILIEVE